MSTQYDDHFEFFDVVLDRLKTKLQNNLDQQLLINKELRNIGAATYLLGYDREKIDIEELETIAKENLQTRDVIISTIDTIENFVPTFKEYFMEIKWLAETIEANQDYMKSCEDEYCMMKTARKISGLQTELSRLLDMTNIYIDKTFTTPNFNFIKAYSRKILKQF